MLFKSSKRQSRDLFIHSMIMGVLSFLVPTAPLFGHYAFLILFISYLCTGFGRAYSFIPYFIFNQHFDGANKDKRIVRIWIGLADLFSVFALLSFNVLMYNFQWSWEACMVLSVSLFMIISTIFYLTV